MNEAQQQVSRKRVSRGFLFGTICVLALIITGVFITIRATNKGPEKLSGTDDIPTKLVQADEKQKPNPCKNTDIELQSFVAEKKYAAGKNPVFSFTVTNNSNTQCYMDFGTAKQNFVVKSGDTQVWQSSDCQKPGDVRLIVIQPKQTLKSASFEWNRTKSEKGKCDGPKEPVAPGGYKIQVNLEGTTAKEAAQFILE